MKKTLKIEGMMCKHCQKHVEDALNKIEGVVSVIVNLSDKTAIVILDAEVSDEILSNAVKDAGYDVVSVE